MNGKPNSTMLFGNLELHLYLDETSLAVDERRHGDVMHMPQAILNLQEVIAGQLKEKYTPPVPLQDWNFGQQLMCILNRLFAIPVSLMSNSVYRFVRSPRLPLRECTVEIRSLICCSVPKQHTCGFS